VTRVSTHSPDPPGSAIPVGRSRAYGPAEGHGPIEWVMSTVIRKLAWSRLSDPKVALSVSGVGLLLGMLVGATAPNTMTLPIRLPLSYLLPSLNNNDVLATAMLYTGDVLACLGLAGLLWAHSQGWRPDPRRLLLASAAVVAVMVSLTPVGSSDTASYAAYGRIASLGGNPYVTSPLAALGPHSPYVHVVGAVWKNQVTVYGPIATLIQWFAALIGGPSVATTIWALMILNGAVFIGVGFLLLKTSDDPVRATLFWTANVVLLQQLVSGGQLDTFVAAAALCAIQVARRAYGVWGDALVGVLLGLAFGIKVSAALVAIGLAWPLLRRREWLRVTRMAAIALATALVEYSFYGLNAMKSTFDGLKWVIMPSPWRLFQMAGEALGFGTMTTVINILWPIALFVVAWFIYRRISSDQPREVVAPFALTFAWVLVAPWVFAWYTAIAWATLTLVPRNRMTRWLALVTVFLALWLSTGGQAAPGRL
jgi:Glycosyltransferase family 87